MVEIVDEWADSISYTTLEDYVIKLVDKEEPVFLPNVIVNKGMRGSQNNCEELDFIEIKRGSKTYTQAYSAVLHESTKEEYYQVSVLANQPRNFLMESSKIETIFTLKEYRDMCIFFNEKLSENIPSINERYLEFSKYKNAYIL